MKPSYATLLTYSLITTAIANCLDLTCVQLRVTVALAALFNRHVVYDVLQYENGCIPEELIYVQACQCRCLDPVVQLMLPRKGQDLITRYPSILILIMLITNEENGNIVATLFSYLIYPHP